MLATDLRRPRGPIVGSRAWAWVRRQAGEEAGKETENQRGVKEGEREVETAYVPRKGQHRASVGGYRTGDSLLARGGHPSPEITTE